MVNTFDGPKAAHLLPRQKNHVQVLWMGCICLNWLDVYVQNVLSVAHLSVMKGVNSNAQKVIEIIQPF